MRRLWILSLLLCAGAGVVPDSVALRFSPEDGSTSTLTFERVLRLELDSSEQSVVYDGEEQGGEDPPPYDFELTETESITFTDTFGVEEGELRRVSRTFDLVRTLYESQLVDPEGEDFSEESTGKSELEEATVIFRWEAEEEAFEASFAEESEDLDEELLEGLEARADLGDFLPDEPVEVGDTWEPDIAAFVRMSNLSGDLRVIPEGEEESDNDFGEQFDDNLTGDIEAELVEVRESDAGRLAVIRLELDLSTTIEIEEELDADEVTGSEKESHVFEFSLEGELLWDVRRGWASSLQLKGDVTMTTTITSDYQFEGHEMNVEELQEYSGTLVFEATLE